MWPWNRALFASKKLDGAVLKFRRKTYLFTGTASEFNNVKAWKMTEVGNDPSFEAGKLEL